jgi:hypothetical protein
MKRLALLAIFLALPLTGCPSLNTTQQQALANASDNAAKIVGAAQQVEITAHNNTLISDADHQFIETQFNNLGQLGLATDSCIGKASTKTAAIACLQAYTTGAQNIGAQSVGIKSAQAQAEFNLTITSVEGVLDALQTELGN